jgi:hypothetical protein
VTAIQPGFKLPTFHRIIRLFQNRLKLHAAGYGKRISPGAVEELFFSELMPPAADTTDSKLKNFLQKFLVLRGAPRELWIIYAAYILENLAYKVGAAGVLPLWLSSDLGFNDVRPAR